MASPSGEEGAPAARVPAALPLPAVGLHGAAGVFDSSREEWSEYAERLGHYFVANDVKTLASPLKLDEFTFQGLVDLAGKYFSPRPSPIVKRFEFNSRRQKEGESIATYVAELRKIAEHCDFGAVLSDMLRDRLVCGAVHKGIQRRLLV